jgi:branched-chain amino acid transport system ATP-binding protein
MSSLRRPATSSGAGAMTTPILKLANVESAYGPIRAIRGVSLDVIQGQIATVLGSNGAGKTTILKTISGIIDPRRGSIEFDGQDITAHDPALIVQRGLSHVPEGREVFPLLSVHDNLLMGAYTRKRPRPGGAATSKPCTAIFRSCASGPARTPALLSGGQQQMLAISRAIMAAPKLILLDEPSLGLSPRLTKEIFEIVVRINRERGTSMLLVEQNANMALNAADFGYVLENGRIVMQDACARLREKDDIKEFYPRHEGNRRARRTPLEKEKELEMSLAMSNTLGSCHQHRQPARTDLGWQPEKLSFDHRRHELFWHAGRAELGRPA